MQTANVSGAAQRADVTDVSFEFPRRSGLVDPAISRLAAAPHTPASSRYRLLDRLIDVEIILIRPGNLGVCLTFASGHRHSYEVGDLREANAELRRLRSKLDGSAVRPERAGGKGTEPSGRVTIEIK
jgi:hypothetical protein